MERNLTEGKVSSVLLPFVLPFLAAMVLQFLYSIVDMMIVGQFADAAAISAVNTSGQIMQMVTSIVQGIATGGTVLIGQKLGAGDQKGVRQAVSGLVRIIVVLSVIMTVLFLTCNRLLISLAQVPEAAVLPARRYLWICSLGTFFIAGYNGVAGVLRGLGDSKHPMYFVSISCILNIFGDLLLVGVFRMGAAGAALATVAAQAIAFLLAMITLQRSSCRLDRETLKPGGAAGATGRILKLGIPLAAQDTLANLSFLLITVIVNTIGLEQSAAVGVVERIIGFCMLISIAFMSALSAFTAQNMGAGKPERASQALKLSLGICIGASLIICGLAELLPGQIMRLFTADQVVIGHGVSYLRTYCLDILMVAFVFCLNGFFSGCGKTRFTLANSLISTFVVRVPLVWFVSRIAGVTLMMIGIAAPTASLTQILMQLVYYRLGSWRTGLQTGK